MGLPQQQELQAGSSARPVPEQQLQRRLGPGRLQWLVLERLQQTEKVAQGSPSALPAAPSPMTPCIPYIARHLGSMWF